MDAFTRFTRNQGTFEFLKLLCLLLHFNVLFCCRYFVLDRIGPVSQLVTINKCLKPNNGNQITLETMPISGTFSHSLKYPVRSSQSDREDTSVIGGAALELCGLVKRIICPEHNQLSQ
jgi:hypothetical protein